MALDGRADVGAALARAHSSYAPIDATAVRAEITNHPATESIHGATRARRWGPLVNAVVRVGVIVT